MATSLYDLTPGATFDGLLKTGDNLVLDGTLRVISDGLGNESALSLSTSEGLLANPTFLIGGEYVTTTEVSYLIGVTSPIQSQLNALAELSVPRVATIVSSATPSVDTDNYNFVSITALATAITSMSSGLSGTPVNFQRLTFRIKDNGTARAINWGSSFIAMGVALPTTTVISKVLTVGFFYDSVIAKWGCVASTQEA